MRHRSPRALCALLLAISLIAAACSGGDDDPGAAPADEASSGETNDASETNSSDGSVADDQSDLGTPTPEEQPLLDTFSQLGEPGVGVPRSD